MSTPSNGTPAAESSSSPPSTPHRDSRSPNASIYQTPQTTARNRRSTYQDSPTRQPQNGSKSPRSYGTLDENEEGDTPSQPSMKTRLLDGYNRMRGYNTCCSDKETCEHGIRSPRASSPENPMDFGGRRPGPTDTLHSVLGDTFADGLLGTGQHEATWRSTTQWLANKHGVKRTKMMYLFYYIPFFQWITQYKWSYLKGDLIAALTMASFYLPMSLSYADNLAHVPPVNGLYAFVFNPFIYALLGSCPQMVVGPEAAGSLLTGSVVRNSIDSGHHHDEDQEQSARVAGLVTGMAGCVILLAGLMRQGYLDSVLSRPFLRGFISAIGFIIFIDQLIPMTGLVKRVKHVGGVAHGSTGTKIWFLLTNIQHSHSLTAGVGLGSFAVIMVCREIKRRLQPRFPNVAYVPDRFMIVVISAVLTWRFGWSEKGLSILGNMSGGGGLNFNWPIKSSFWKYMQSGWSTALIIGLLGFFESSVAAKSLGSGDGSKDGIQGMSLSANRELVALGVANVAGGLFTAIPAFGGYGRSKVNASTGGKTPMSSVFLSGLALICVLFLIPYFYYLPKAVLSAMISVVAWSLIEEAPHDIKFFISIRGWYELVLIALIFVSSIFWNLTLGIGLGFAASLLSVIRHATKPRIQILGRVPGTEDVWENAEDNPERLEFIDGCLIIKIPEPLTFANTGDLKNRLKRLEMYGTTTAHPALPRVRAPEHNQNIIFDVHGVTGIDGSGTQVLLEIVKSYRDKGVRVFFCRVMKEDHPVFCNFERSGIVDLCGGSRHFVKSVDEALKMTELESVSEAYLDDPENGEQNRALY